MLVTAEESAVGAFGGSRATRPFSKSSRRKRCFCYGESGLCLLSPLFSSLKRRAADLGVSPYERCGEMVERIGLVNFLEGVGIDVDPNMVNDPRQSSYVRMDGWDEEAEKWFNRKAEEKAAAAG